MKAVFRYPGAKWSLADWIIEHFPAGYERLAYLEPFVGSGAVFFNKRPSQVETINDLDSNIVNFFKVLREQPDNLRRAIELTPYSREEYEEAIKSFHEDEAPLEMARKYFVRVMQGVGAKSNARGTWRLEPRPYPGGAAKKWYSCTDILTEAACRLRGIDNLVQIEHRDAMDLIERFDNSNVLMYLDPPYVRSARRSGSLYRHEMDDEGQARLLKAIQKSKAHIIISGYNSDIYNEALCGWHRDSTLCHTTSGEKAEEVIWVNYNPPTEQYSFFKEGGQHG